MIAYLDCSTGVSGDKFLGALLDAGTASGAFTADHLVRLAATLAPEARVTVERTSSHGIAACGVRVEAAEQPAHRHWRDIRAMLEGADLPEPVRASALRTFEALAVAEAAAHGCAIDAVHFHEVGAIDSIVDIVGVCAGVHALGIDAITASPVAVGSGTVRTSHGELPVPAPATIRLLVDASVVPGSASGELTTPTGAALLRGLGAGFGPCPAMTPRLVGFGAGTRDIGMPNVCMLVVGAPQASLDLESQSVAVLETNLDHLSPEAIAAVTAQLLAEGAADVWTTPLTMKKGRPGVLLSVLATGPDDVARAFAERIVALTGSLGVRVTPIVRYVAEREVREIPTRFGPINVKVGPEGAESRLRPEADDVARIARETSQPYAVVERELRELARSILGD